MQERAPTEPPQDPGSVPPWPRLRIGTGASAGASMRAVQAAINARRRPHQAAARSVRS